MTWSFDGALGGTRTPNLLIRSNGQTVQTCPGVAVLWADVLGPSYRVCSWPWSWQQFWQQPARSPLAPPVLANDGADLAAALQTIREIGNAAALDAAVDLAFPGSQVSIESDSAARLDLRLRQHGLLRPLGVAELSDGTLRYLLWIAGLLTHARRACWCSTSPRPACTRTC